MGIETLPRWPDLRLPLLAGNILIPFVVVLSSAHVAAVGAAVFLHGLLCYHMLWPPARGLGPVVRRFRTNAQEVWLTIDDGPSGERTVALGKALAERGARATFFVIGERLRQQNDVARQVLALGHTLSNHSDSHRVWTFWISFPARIRGEIRRNQEALRAVGAAEGRAWFRAPAGHKSIFLHPELRAVGMRLIGWTRRALDGVRCNPAKVVRRICTGVKGGDILLLHEGKHDRHGLEASNDCILLVVDELRRRGFRCIIPQDSQLV